MKESSNETAEKYLEAILILSKTKPVVRSVDVSRQLNRSKSCVSKDTAALDANKLKHYISDESLEAIKSSFT